MTSDQGMTRGCDAHCAKCGVCGAGANTVCMHCSTVMMGICMSNG